MIDDPVNRLIWHMIDGAGRHVSRAVGNWRRRHAGSLWANSPLPTIASEQWVEAGLVAVINMT